LLGAVGGRQGKIDRLMSIAGEIDKIADHRNPSFEFKSPDF
jgi:hypothetical protein